MATGTRRERDRAQRHQLIIEAARELAEAEGWDSVTTRRLAERVEYSQPVLYSHFDGKDAIVRAVAIEGFGELADALRRARLAAVRGPVGALLAVCQAYIDFAVDSPALYQAMFVMPTDIRFASDETPPPLRDAFGEFVSAVSTDTVDRELVAEVIWASLHGLVVLAATGRIPPAAQAERVALLVARFAGAV